MNIDDEIRAVIASQDTSCWLKKALTDAMQRDALDALHDAELLADLLKRRFETLAGGRHHAKA